MHLILIIYFIIVGIPIGFFYWFGLGYEATWYGFMPGQFLKDVVLSFIYYGFHLFLLIRILTSRRKLRYIIASCLIWVIAIGGFARNATMIMQEAAEDKKQKAAHNARIHGETELSPQLKAMSISELLHPMDRYDYYDPLGERDRRRAIIDRGEAAVPELIQSLKNSDEYRVRSNAAYHLGKIGAGAVEAVPVLVSTLEDPDNHEIRRYAVSALKKIGAVPELIQALILVLKNSADVGGRRKAALELGKIGAGEAQVVPALILALEDPNKRVREDATDALGEIGPAAHEAIPFLVAAMKEGVDDQTRDSNTSLPWTLVKIGPPETVLPALLEVSSGPKGRMQSNAADALRILRSKLEAEKRRLQEKKITSPSD